MAKLQLVSLPRGKLVEDTAQILRQNGVALNAFALSMLTDANKFTDMDIKTIQERALLLNTSSIQ